MEYLYMMNFYMQNLRNIYIKDMHVLQINKEKLYMIKMYNLMKIKNLKNSI